MIADGSGKSIASTRTTLETTILRLHVDILRGTNPARRDALSLSLSSRFSHEATVEDDRQRIASSEAAQREMQQFMTQFMTSQQSVG